VINNSQYLNNIASNDKITNNLERVRKEVVVAYSTHYPGNYLEGCRKNTDIFRRTGVPVEIPTENFPNTNLHEPPPQILPFET
jgi:hypothetical protein